MRRLFSLFNVVSAALLAAAAYAYQEVQRPPETPRAPALELAERRDVQVRVYFTDARVQTMKPEARTVQVVQENPGSVAQAALNVWAQGPKTSGSLPVVPKGTPAVTTTSSPGCTKPSCCAARQARATISVMEWIS